MEPSELLTVLEDTLPTMVGYWNRELRNEYATKAYLEYFGWEPDQIVGVHLRELLGDDMYRKNLPHVQLALAGRPQEFERTLIDQYGHTRHMQVSYVPDVKDGTVRGFVAQIIDVTEKAEALHESLASRREYRMLAENANDVVWRLDEDSVMTWVSPSLTSVMGWEPEQLLGTKPRALTHPDDQNELTRRRADMFAGRPIPTSELRMRCADGQYRWMSVQVRPISSPEGVVTGAVVGLRDVHAAVLSRAALAQSERILRLAIDQSPQGMAVESLDGRWLIVNEKLAVILGRSTEWLRNHRVLDLMHEHDIDDYLHMRTSLLSSESDVQVHEFRFVHGDGTGIWLGHSARAIRDEQGQPTHLVSQYDDVTAARADRAALESLVAVDELTGLPNRRSLTRHLTELSDRLIDDPKLSVAVLFGDVDHFKSINDTYGHKAGDYVLQAIAQRLVGAARDDDFVARVSGDEFILILTGVPSRAAATAIANDLARHVHHPLPLNETCQIHPSMSFGVAHGVGLHDVQELIEGADKDLYVEKHLRPISA